jgi:hypothetical protein
MGFQEFFKHQMSKKQRVWIIGLVKQILHDFPILLCGHFPIPDVFLFGHSLRFGKHTEKPNRKNDP